MLPRQCPPPIDILESAELKWHVAQPFDDNRLNPLEGTFGVAAGDFM